jgi:hypothetical protein
MVFGKAQIGVNKSNSGLKLLTTLWGNNWKNQSSFHRTKHQVGNINKQKQGLTNFCSN